MTQEHKKLLISTLIATRSMACFLDSNVHRLQRTQEHANLTLDMGSANLRLKEMSKYSLHFA